MSIGDRGTVIASSAKGRSICLVLLAQIVVKQLNTPSC